MTVFAAIDHCTAECVGIHVVKKAHRFEALEPIRQGVREHFGGFSGGIAAALCLRHDHGSVYMSHDFQSEVAFLGILSSPSFIRQPEGNGCIKRFFRTLEEQLLWIRRFPDLDTLRMALQDFLERYKRDACSGPPWFSSCNAFGSVIHLFSVTPFQLSIPSGPIQAHGRSSLPDICTAIPTVKKEERPSLARLILRAEFGDDTARPPIRKGPAEGAEQSAHPQGWRRLSPPV